MPLDIQSLRTMGADISQFTVTDSGAVQKQGFAHRLKSFFGFRSAVAENAQTIAAIRQAIQNEPNFFADDVKQRATALLDAVRTDRAISATKIRSIIGELDAMSGPTERKRAQAQRITAHLANPNHQVPACFQGRDDKWREFQTLVRARLTMDEPPGGFVHQDFASEIAQYEQVVQDMFDGLADVEGGVDELWGVFERDGFRRSSAGLRDIADLQAIAVNVRSTLAEAKAVGEAHGPRMRALVLDSLHTMQRPFPAGTTTKLVNAGTTLPKMGLDRLNAQSSVTEIHKAICSFTKAISSYDFEAHDIALSGPDENSAAGMLLTAAAIDALPEETKRNILAALSSEDGRNLLAFYDSQTVSPEAVNVIGMISRMTENIKSSLGMENPTERLPRPREPDLSKIPLAVRTSFLVQEIVTGDRGMPGKLGIMRYAEKIGDFRTRMNEYATASQAVNIAKQLAAQSAAPENQSPFEVDLARTLQVRMPDGSLLANGTQNLAAGKDKIVQVITGDANATFANASPTDKMKASIVMAVMNQSCNGITLNAFAQSLNRDPTGAMPPFTFSEKSSTRMEEHSIRREENGDITMTLKYRANTDFLTVAKNGKPEHIPLDDASYIEYEMTTRISAADLDKLAQADWSKFDANPVSAADDNSYSGAFVATNRIPPAYRFQGTVESHIHVNIAAAR